MRPLILALFLAGCGTPPDAEQETPASWDIWLNHGLPGACHGMLTMETSDYGDWQCGDTSGIVQGRLVPDVRLDLDTDDGPITIRGVVRDYDGAIIAKTPDGRPFVGYVK